MFASLWALDRSVLFASGGALVAGAVALRAWQFLATLQGQVASQRLELEAAKATITFLCTQVAAVADSVAAVASEQQELWREGAAAGTQAESFAQGLIEGIHERDQLRDSVTFLRRLALRLEGQSEEATGRTAAVHLEFAATFSVHDMEIHRVRALHADADEMSRGALAEFDSRLESLEYDLEGLTKRVTGRTVDEDSNSELHSLFVDSAEASDLGSRLVHVEKGAALAAGLESRVRVCLHANSLGVRKPTVLVRVPQVVHATDKTSRHKPFGYNKTCS